MWHCRKLNNKIDNLHETALRVVYTDREKTFKELIVRGNSVSVHRKNLQRVAAEGTS